MEDTSKLINMGNIELREVEGCANIEDCVSINFTEVYNECERLARMYPFVLDEFGVNNLEHLPIGWLKSFVELMLADIKAVIDKDKIKYKVTGASNCYGELRWDDLGGNIETEMIIHKYSEISKHICVGCGKTDVKRSSALFQFPYCDDCFKELGCVSDRDFRDFKKEPSNNKKIPSSLRYWRMELGKLVPYDVDISKTVNNVRKHCGESLIIKN